MDTKKLRQKILDLAIRGKLVPQDPNDEPASVLLERIRAEKERLIKEGKIKRSKKSTTDDEIEAPFEIPESWEWTRLCDITELIEDCPHSTAKDEGHGYPLIRTPNVGEGYLILDGVHRVSESVYNKRNARAVPETNDIIYAREAPAGNAAVIKEDEIVCLGQRTVLIRPFKKFVNSKLLAYFIISPHSKNSLISTAVGSTATHVNLENIRPFIIPIPPLPEQLRIVLSIERWFSVIDALESNEGDLLKAIDQAKSKILDLAIHGKLVPQDPNDEPAIELLKRINPKFEPCDNAQDQFEIPNSWEWITIDDVCEVARGGSPRPIKDYLTDAADGINWIKIGDTEKNGKYINSAKEHIKPEGKSKSRYVHKGDFLLTNSMSFGHPYILNIDGCIHDGWLVISPLENAFNTDFLYHLLSSVFVYDQFSKAASGGVVSNLNSEKVAKIIVPHPPYSEQLRIVSKIEELFAVLDSIKESLE